jgi:hypothetical protein
LSGSVALTVFLYLKVVNKQVGAELCQAQAQMGSLAETFSIFCIQKVENCFELYGSTTIYIIMQGYLIFIFSFY